MPANENCPYLTCACPSHHRAALDARDVFVCEILLEGNLNDAERAKLLEIANRCPVHVSLHSGSDVRTTLAQTDIPMSGEPSAHGEHMKVMEESCESKT